MSISLLKKAAAVIISVGAMCTAAIAASAATTPCTYYTGSNVSAQEYPGYRHNWSGTVNSYLSARSDGTFMRVQATGKEVFVEYFDKNFNCTSQKLLGAELPIFGAFYETSSNYYLLTGQTNPGQSANVECYRLTKYTKDWTRVRSVGLYNCNTTVPFDAGSARITEEGKYLIVRTCHEMYSGHQANVTIEYDTDSMTVTDSYTDVMNVKYGYVSHSFNQFVKTENGKIVAVDHGDAYPRSVVLIKYPTSAAGGKFTPTYSNQCSTITMLSIPGEVGDNYTGVTVGGFEISSSSYIVVGSKTDLSGSSDTRNVYVSVADKSTGAVKVTELTSYSGSAYRDGATTPHLAKIGTDSYMVLWERGDTVYYTRIDGKGNKVGSISSFTGHLSDCAPVVSGGKLIWYVWDSDTVDFYTIDLSSYKAAKSASLKYGHELELKSVSGDTATLKCKKCSKTFTEKVATDFSIRYLMRIDNGVSLSIFAPDGFDVGDKQDVDIFVIGDVNSRFEATSSDESVLSVSDRGGNFTLTALKPGTATITFRPVYNPSVKKTVTFKVAHDFEEKIITQATCSKEGQKQLTCKGCGHKETAVIPKKAHSYTTKTVAPTYTAEGYTEYTCSVCGYSYKNYTAKKTVPAVSGLALKGRSSDALRIAWTKNTTADGYIIEMKDGSKWVRVGKITKNSTVEFRKAGLKAGTAYSFRVKAYKMVGKDTFYSGYTSISARTNPSAVTGLKLKGRAADALRLAWTKNTSADGYIIERKDGTKWVRIAKLTNNSTTEYRVEKLKAGTAYDFRIRTYKMSGKTALYSGYTAISACTNPSSVSGLKLKAAAKDAVRLAWTKNTSADGYIIEMQSGNSWVRVGKITSNATVEFKKSGLKSNTSYSFRVKTYKLSGKTALYGTPKTITVKTK